jgi:hypothetical protein
MEEAGYPTTSNDVHTAAPPERVTQPDTTDPEDGHNVRPLLSLNLVPEHTVEGVLDGHRLGFPRDLDVVREEVDGALTRAFRSKWTERVTLTLTVHEY